MSYKKKPIILLLVIIILSAAAVFAADRSKDNVWSRTKDSDLSNRQVDLSVVPKEYAAFRLNKTALKTILTGAPLEQYTVGLASEMILTLPMPDGTYQRFAIKESPIMEAELAAKFPEIKTYLGQGIDNPTAPPDST